MTASPAQRIVMLYDRLLLDIRLARSAGDTAGVAEHVTHGIKIVAELYGSLDTSHGGPADNLASIYTFLLTEMMATRSTGTTERLSACEEIVDELRSAWAGAAELIAAGDGGHALAAPALRAQWG